MMIVAIALSTSNMIWMLMDVMKEGSSNGVGRFGSFTSASNQLVLIGRTEMLPGTELI